MATSYPTSLQDLDATRGTDNDPLSAPNHVDHHTLEDQTIEALQTKVGIDNSADTNSIDYKLTNPASSNPGHKHTLSAITDITASATEVNYTDGVTSNIQTQLDAKQARSTLTTKGDIYVATASGIVTRLGVGANNQVLTADSSQSTGIKWSAISAKFGGDSSDGSLSVSSGTTNIDVGGARIFVRNYLSISITGTGKVTFSNPHSQGTTIILRSAGDVTLTSSQAPMLDASGMGVAGGTGGSAGVGNSLQINSTPPSSGLDGTTNVEVFTSGNYFGAGGAAETSSAQTGGTGGTGKGIALDVNTGASSLYTDTMLRLTKVRAFNVLPGYGGGGGGGGGGSRDVATSTGGTGGAGGRGGGALIIECAGSWNFTTTNGISVAGVAGSTGGASSNKGGGGGGGGGGSGGWFIGLYNSLTSNTGTITISGGSGGGSGSAGGTAGVSGAGGGGGGQGGGHYAGAGTAGNNGTAGSGTTPGAGGSGGAGASGVSFVALNTLFA